MITKTQAFRLTVKLFSVIIYGVFQNASENGRYALSEQAKSGYESGLTREKS